MSYSGQRFHGDKRTTNGKFDHSSNIFETYHCYYLRLTRLKFRSTSPAISDCHFDQLVQYSRLSNIDLDETSFPLQYFHLSTQRSY
jgi:hypothetical protein